MRTEQYERYMRGRKPNPNKMYEVKVAVNDFDGAPSHEYITTHISEEELFQLLDREYVKKKFHEEQKRAQEERMRKEAFEKAERTAKRLWETGTYTEPRYYMGASGSFRVGEYTFTEEYMYHTYGQPGSRASYGYPRTSNQSTHTGTQGTHTGTNQGSWFFFDGDNPGMSEEEFQQFFRSFTGQSYAGRDDGYRTRQQQRPTSPQKKTNHIRLAELAGVEWPTEISVKRLKIRAQRKCHPDTGGSHELWLELDKICRAMGI